MPLPHLQIIGHPLCPYVQRAVITMLELEIPYDRKDISLENKPDWLSDLSPTGKVPVLIVNNGPAMFESNVIAEYLMEIKAQPFHPNDALKRGMHRAWIAYGDQILDVIANLIYRVQTKKDQEQDFGKIAGMFAILDTQVGEGPYFDGNHFHLIDAVFATVFRYLPVIGPLSSVDLFDNCSSLKSWSMSLAKRPSVKRAVPHHFDEQLRKFIAGQNSFAAMQLS